MNSMWFWEEVDAKTKAHFEKIKMQSSRPESMGIKEVKFNELELPSQFSIESRLQILDGRYDILFRQSPLIIKDGWLREHAENYVKEKKAIEETSSNEITKDNLIKTFVNAGFKKQNETEYAIKFDEFNLYVNFFDHGLVIGLTSRNDRWNLAQREIQYAEGFDTINFYYKQYCDAFNYELSIKAKMRGK